VEAKIMKGPNMKDQLQVIFEHSFFKHQGRKCRWRAKSTVCAVACLWAVTTVHAVFPPPDGGYAGGNTAEGTQSLFNLAGGLNNTAIGYRALFNDINASGNTGLGAVALFANTTGTGNTATGFRTLVANTTGNNNTGDGFEALTHNTIGMQNTGIGNLALANNVTGNFNTAVGTFTLGNNTVGSSNIALGDGAGFNLTIGNYNIDIGNAGVAAEANTIRIGTAGKQTNAYMAGIYGVLLDPALMPMPVFCDNTGHLGTLVSSARFKENIKPMGQASDSLLSLKPVTFRYKPQFDSVGVPQFGLVAEEVEKVDPNLVIHDDKGKPYSVRYEAVNAMLLNEFLKEHKKVEEQQGTIAQLKSTVAKQQQGFEAKLAQQQRQIETLTVGLQKVSVQLELSKSAPQTVLNNR
jgi:trimeric autotransporter adhesin